MIFLLTVGHIFLLICMSGNFWLDVGHCVFTFQVLGVFLFPGALLAVCRATVEFTGSTLIFCVLFIDVGRWD